MKCVSCGIDLLLSGRKYREQPTSPNGVIVALCDDGESACARKRQER